jgi:UDP-N-acetylmuramoyl-tripeptide--D-alanyl-D-alanine ligase
MFDTESLTLDPNTPLGPISIDSRALKPDDTFWAVQGTRDGHEFVFDAFAKGAKLAVVNRAWWERNSADVRKYPMVVVGDTRATLSEAGKAWRERFTFPVIGITGTNGKTSTKDLILKLLSLRFTPGGTKGNLNNDLGVPLTLLDIPLDCDIAVIEMGANHLGEISQLCKVSQPTHGLVTSIGKAHLEGFGSLEALAHTKGELYDAVADSGVAFVPTDDELCRREAELNPQKIGYGFQPRPNEWTGEFHQGKGLHFDEQGRALFRFDDVEIRLGLPGRPAAIAALSALTVASHFWISPKACQAEIESWTGLRGRVDIFTAGGVTIMDDSYNANPPSMIAALETLSHLQGKRRVAVLGDMNELGEYAEEEHRKLGEAVSGFKIDQAIFVGPVSKIAAQAASKGGVSTAHFANYELLEPHLKHLIQNGDVVLVKASRGMKLERVVDYLKAART